MMPMPRLWGIPLIELAGGRRTAAPTHQPTVGFLEPNGPSNHDVIVRQTLVASGVPNEDIRFLGWDTTENAATGGMADPAPESLDDWLSSFSGSLNFAADQVETVLNDPNSRIRVINMSYASSNVLAYEKAYKWYQNDAAFRRKVQEQLGLNDRSTDKEIRQALVNHIDATLANDRSVQRGFERWRAVTRRAANEGVAIVVAVGNDQDEILNWRAQGVTIRDDAGYNNLAKSDHVIAVGALDDQGTPNDFTDDEAARFSSRGGDRYRPTLVADGVGIQGQYDGTSFSAPQVAGTVERIWRANPNLRYDQVVQILRSTAHDNPNIPANAEGAGMLRPDEAVAQARRLLRR